MTATTRGSPVGGNDSQGQGQAPDAQSQPPLPQNQVSIIFLTLVLDRWNEEKEKNPKTVIGMKKDICFCFVLLFSVNTAQFFFFFFFCWYCSYLTTHRCPGRWRERGGGGGKGGRKGEKAKHQWTEPPEWWIKGVCVRVFVRVQACVG